MRISYGPSGHKGVTHLLAVGADDLDAVDDESKNVMIGAVGVTALGLLAGSSMVRNIGLGGVLALLGVRYLRSRHKVAVTQPVATRSM